MMTRKTKMVSFRVSPYEYDKLRNACMAQGVASVSELVRAAMDRVIAVSSTSRTFEEQLRDLRDRVQGLTADIDRLSQHVGIRASAAGSE